MDVASRVAEQAALAAQSGDWVPVFVYGSMTWPQCWDALLGRLPEMNAAMLRGYVRRRLRFGGFAAALEEPERIIVGHLVTGLKPAERWLLDRAIDDGFELVPAKVKLLGEDDEIDCATYLWRFEFEDAVDGELDWDMETFMDEGCDEFLEHCKDLRAAHAADNLPEEELLAQVQERLRKNKPKDEDDDDP